MNNIASAMREREKAFETQYKLSAELQFKVRARRDRLFGEWAAKKIGLDGEKAKAYAIEAAQLDLEEAGDENLIRKVVTDLNRANIQISDQEMIAVLLKAQHDAVASYTEDLEKNNCL